MIDVPLSLATGTAQLPVNEPGYSPPANYTPPAGFSLVGGLTGVVGTNQVYPTVAAIFNSFQPTVNQLGLLTVGTSTAATNPSGGLVLVRQFTTVSQKAIQSDGAFIAVTPNNKSHADRRAGGLRRFLPGDQHDRDGLPRRHTLIPLPC